MAIGQRLKAKNQKMKKLPFLVFVLWAAVCPAQRPGYWQQAVDYAMDIDVDAQAYRYDGKMALRYANHSAEYLPKVYFHLYFNAFQPGSMMDHRLANIADPDRRMVDNIGTKENPVYQSRIAKLAPDRTGHQNIKSLTMDGLPAAFRTDGTILEVALPRAIAPGETVRFDMEWNAQVPEQIRRSGRNSKEGVALSMAQWYPKMAHFDAFGWHLDEYVAREFIAPFGHFDVTVRLDSAYVVGASGKLQNPLRVKGYDPNAAVETENGKAVWRFRAENIHDFAWAADPKFVVDSARTQGGTTVYAVYVPTNAEVRENWRAALDLAAEFFDFCAPRFGTYPWETYSIVQGGDGGMEYGTATLVTGGRNLKSLVGVIFHEAAHSWFQHLFGINETVDEWFDEGFASYMAELAMRHLFEKRGGEEANPVIDAYRAYYALARSGKEEPMSLLADYYDTNYAYSHQAYNKGQVFVQQLEYIIGRENLEKTFLKFYERWKFRHPTPNDFKRVAEEVSGINLKWYFNLFINTVRTVDYAVTDVSDGEIRLLNRSNFAMPIDLLVEYEDGSKELFYIPLREMRGEKPAENLDTYQGVKRTVLEDWFWTKPEYAVKTDKKPKNVVIDPSRRLINYE